MGLLSKFKSSPVGAKDARAGTAAASALSDANEFVRDARLRARRRLIGAALLLGIGIIGFPLLFETQPRPVAVDIPIEIPSREAVAPLQSSTGTRPARVAQTQAARPPLETAAPTGPASMAGALEPAPRAAEAAPPEPKPDPKPAVEAKPAEARVAEPKPARAPETKPAEAKPAEAKPTPKPAEAEPNGATDDGRFVVQIGAFAEATSARDARMKVEAMGLKTYTQVIESATGRRIRVRIGPYATKAEADKAASRVKASGLQAAVLKL